MKLRKTRSRSVAFVFGVVVFFICADQVTKYLVERWDAAHIFCNYGIALGFSALGKTQEIVIVAMLGVAVLLLHQRLERATMSEIIGYAALIGGGFSNAADRVLFGCVRDFLPFVGWFWFNIADVSIFAGLLLIMINSARK